MEGHCITQGNITPAIMTSSNMIVTLPINFFPRRSSGTKEFRRSSSAGTVATEKSSICASSAHSVGPIGDVDDFLESLEASARSGASIEEDDDALKNLLLRYGQDDADDIPSEESSLESSDLSGASSEVHALKKMMSCSEEQDTLTDLKTVDDARIDTLALKVEELEGRHNRERRAMRKLRRQARILKAQEEYMECLEALASTDIISDEEFLEEHGFAWKEVELDWET
jgi:hypothetical protein